MDFKPIVTDRLKTMDGRIFRSEPMGLREQIVAAPLSRRLTYDPETNQFFVNFEALSINDRQDIANIKTAIEKILKPLDRKVYTIVNYDNFYIRPDLEDEYIGLIKYLMEVYYERATRYTTSAFLRMKLGDALKSKQVSPQMYGTCEEAQKALKDS